MPLLQGRGVVLQAPVLSPGFPLDGEDTKVLLYLPVYTLAPHPPTVTRKQEYQGGRGVASSFSLLCLPGPEGYGKIGGQAVIREGDRERKNERERQRKT